MTKDSIRLVLWDQLTPQISALRDAAPNRDKIVILETIEEASYVNHHVKKLTFLFSAMRHFAAELKSQGFDVFYIKIEEEEASLKSGIQKAASHFRCKKIIATHPGEYRILKILKSVRPLIEIREDDRFFCSLSQFSSWAKGQKKLLMEQFYRKMRIETGILIDKKGEPMGGQWNFDLRNRNPVHRKIDFPAPLASPPDAITKQVIKEVKSRFSKHFGDLQPFWFAVTAKEAEHAFAHFLHSALPHFGETQDAMLQEESYLHHSVISHYLNAGLLDPKKICTAVHQAYLDKKVPIQSAEGYIRQILGWREYVRGVYWLKMPAYAKLNFFNAKRKLPWFYWSGDTKMNCMKQAISQTRKNGYSHHIQRLMITGNFALLAGILPSEICAWYLAVYADAHEWVELPNTLGMSQYADGGFLATKPYASGGNYIRKMSNFCETCEYDVEKKEGKDACPFNYLYWNFLLEHKKKLKKNPRMSMSYRTLENFSSEKKKKIRFDSKRFLESL